MEMSLCRTYFCTLAMTCAVLAIKSRGEQGLTVPYPPRELPAIPVNGTDITEDPVALQVAFDLGRRAASDVFESGDHISFLHDVECLATPHTDWAVPYDAAAPRILAFAGHRGFLRGVAELRQRSDFAFTLALRPIMYHYPGSRHPSILRHFRAHYRELLEQDWDVILLPANDALNLLDDETLPLIAEKIRAGAAAVFLLNARDWDRNTYDETRTLFHELSPLQFSAGTSTSGAFVVSTAASAAITDGLDWNLWPDAVQVQRAVAREESEVWVSRDGAPVVASGMAGKGRVIAIVPPKLPDGDQSAVLYDTGDAPLMDDAFELKHSLILQALVWAAGGLSTVALTVPDTIDVAVGEVPMITVRLTGEAAALDGVDVSYRYKGPWGTALASGRQPVSRTDDAGGVTFALPAPAISGVHRLDLWVKRGDSVVTWGHAAVRVGGGQRLDATCLQSPTAPGEPAVYRIHTDGRNGELQVRGVDGADRQFVALRCAIADADAVTLDTTLSRHAFNRMTFELLDGQDRIVGRDVEDLFIPRIGLDSLDEQYCILTYGRPSVEPHLLPYLGDLYRAAGFNTIYYHWHSRHRVWETALTGLAGITGTMPPFVKQANFEPELKHCPNKPGVRAKWDTQITSAIADIRTFGSIARVIDDECYMAYAGYRDGEFKGAQACQCENCLALFRSQMAREYSSIAALNEEWGTAFADFADVRVIEEQDIDALGNPSSWLAFRQFMNRVYAECYYGRIDHQHAGLGTSFHVGPGAPNYTTPEGGPTYKGGDYAQLKQSLDFMMAYGGPESELFPDMFVGQPGAQKYDPPLWWQEWGPWQALLRGADALWFYSGKQIIGGEMSWRKHAEWIAHGVHDIVRGAGILIRDAEPLNKQVCILYTPENLAMGWLFGKRQDAWRGFQLAGGRTRSAGTFAALLRNYFCMQARTITADDIAAGALADCRLLLLPATFNLDDQTAQAIAQWVRQGGCLVADVLPATRTRYGKPRQASLLQEVFGVDASQARLHKEAKRWYSVGTDASPDFYPDAMWLPGDTTFLGLTATTSRVFGRMLSREGRESTTFYINAHGEGEAILLNFVLAGLDTSSSGWFQLFGDMLLKRAGVVPPARIVAPKTGAPLPFRPLYAFHYGEATLLGSIRGRSLWTGGRPILVDDAGLFGGNDQARLVWKGARHVYDIRRGAYLGYAEGATIDLPPFEARLLATLPYRVHTVELELADRIAAGAACTIGVRLRTDGAMPGKHAFYMEVLSPTGTQVPLYGCTTTGHDGRTTFTIPFAYNERRGDWRVTVRDVMSGMQAAATIQVD